MTDEDREKIRQAARAIAAPACAGSGEAGASFVQFRPMASEALAVHPHQIEEAREYAAKNGVPTDFTPTGEPIMRTRQHRKAYNKLQRHVDKDGGYGD